MIRYSPRGSALALVAAGSLLFIPHPAAAQEKPPSAFGAALAVTRSTGAATVVIFTSRADAASERFREEFDRGAWARHNRGLVLVTGVTLEDEPGLARTMGIVKVPAARVYGKTEKGVSLLASIPDCTTADALAARLVALQVGLEPPGKGDPAVSQASGQYGVQASQQSPPPAPGWPQVQTPPTSPIAPPSLTISAPTASTTSANIVQVPSQNLLIQQAAPQVFVAPTPAPTVYVAQQPTTTTIATAPVAGNMFLAAPTMAGAPVAPVASAQAMAQAPAAPLAVPASAPTTVGTLTNQSMSVPSSGTRTRVRVRGPGLIASGMARLGERMAELGRTRIEVIQETTLDAPAPQGATNGTTTISTTTAAPVVPPPSTFAVPIQQPTTPQAAPPPSYPTASPQGGHFRHH